jgi:hypothetical protein
VIAQENASTPRWRTRRALFSRLLTTILRTRARARGWLRFASNGDWRGDPTAIFPVRLRPSTWASVPHLPPKLFGLLGALTLANADARAAAILVDEIDDSSRKACMCAPLNRSAFLREVRLLPQRSRSDVVLSFVANSTNRLIASARDGRSFWRRRQSSTMRKNSSDTRI